MSNNKMNYVGIDVSSTELVVTMQKSDKTIMTGEFDNTNTGHKKLIKYITKNKHSAKVCMEATGIYHLDAAVVLAKSENIEVMVVNPKAMKHFGTAMMQRAKTDKVDSAIILEYLLRMEFINWECPDDNTLKIQYISRRIHQLKKMLTQEQNRCSADKYRTSTSCKSIRDSFDVNIKHLQEGIDKLQQELSSLICSIPELEEKYKLLNSIKGIADVSAGQILAELLMLPDGLESKQWVAFAGLDPRTVESGSSINRKRKISKRGNKFLRAALYMPALVAVQHEPNVKEYYERLLNIGKEKKVALVAVMRKLLLAIWGILKSGTTWQGEKFYSISGNNA